MSEPIFNSAEQLTETIGELMEMGLLEVYYDPEGELRVGLSSETSAA